MYLFTLEGKYARSSTQNVHLSLSEFESRDVPSAWTDYIHNLFNSPPPPAGTQPLVINVPTEETAPPIPQAFASFVIFNEAPSISNFKAVVGPNGQVTFSGTVTDDQDITGGSVSITGNGIDLVAFVDEDGHFSVSTVVNAAGDITVAATITDVFGHVSDTAYTMFTPSLKGGGVAVALEQKLPPPPPGGGQGNAAPVVDTADFRLDDDGIVMIVGTVLDDQQPDGYAVTIEGGGNSVFTVTDEFGNFGTAFKRASPAEFTLVIRAYDAFGAVSDEKYLIIPGL